MSRLVFLLVGLVAGLGTPLAGRADDSAEALARVARVKGEFEERFHEEAPVSGRVVAGVLVRGSGRPGLALLPPSLAAGQSACVQVMSRDGRYASRNTFLIPSAASAPTVPLDYPSAHEDFLWTLDSDDLAVLAMPGDCDENDTSGLYVATSRARDEPLHSADAITIFVNSGRSETYVAVNNDPKGKRPRRCAEIEEGRRTGFDTVCGIDLSELESVPERLEIRILRRQYERMLPPTEFDLFLPPAR